MQDILFIYMYTYIFQQKICYQIVLLLLFANSISHSISLSRTERTHARIFNSKSRGNLSSIHFISTVYFTPISFEKHCLVRHLFFVSMYSGVCMCMESGGCRVYLCDCVHQTFVRAIMLLPIYIHTYIDPYILHIDMQCSVFIMPEFHLQLQLCTKNHSAQRTTDIKRK